MRNTWWTTALVAVAVLALVPAGAEATNGYFAHGYGTPSKGVAGAGVAMPFNTLGPATNPAIIAFVGKGYDVELSVFNPNRSYEVLGLPSGFPGTFGLAPGSVDSGSTLFPIPALGANWQLGPSDAFGVAIYGNGGMNTDYDNPTFGFAPTGVDLSQMFLAPTYARKLGANHSLGVTPIAAWQRFCADGLAAFGAFSLDSSRLSDNGYDNSFGFGVRVGYYGQLTHWLALGATYQTKVWMSEMDSYAGLFEGGGRFDVPENWTVGVDVSPVEKVDVLFDVQRVNYSGVEAVGNPMLPNMMAAPLGAHGGAGFGWRDVTTYKAGVQVHTGRADGWTWRAGYSYADQPIPTTEMLFNILAPGVMEQHVTVGLSRYIENGQGFHLAITRAIPTTVSGPNSLEAPGQQEIGLTMDQWEFSIGWSFGR